MAYLSITSDNNASTLSNRFPAFLIFTGYSSPDVTERHLKHLSAEIW